MTVVFLERVERPDLEEAETDELIALVNDLIEGKKQIDAYRKVVEAVIADRIGEGGAVRYGDVVYRWTRGVSEHCVDPQGFWEWFNTQSPAVQRSLFNPNYAKRSPLNELVVVDVETGEVESPRDRFFEQEEEPEAKLMAVPISRAPNFLQQLDDGQVYTKKPKEVTP